MTKTHKIIAAAAVVVALLALGTCAGVLTPDNSAPTYNNAAGGN